jgi:membrane-associated PAP2 superfamily phosphatase
VLVLGALGVLRERTAIWLAIAIGIATLAVEGARFAALEKVSRGWRVVVVALNILLGLSIVGLKVLLSH